jgi:hypothetical protein
MASRLTRHLIWTHPDAPEARAPDGDPKTMFRAVMPGGPEQMAFRAFTASELRGETPAETLSVNLPSVARDRAIYFLHIGAEVEHALMVQYLYAGYSLDASQVQDAGQRALVQQWRETILLIAREEMGHLAAVENILTLIGGPLSFDRQEFPVQNELYPFPFDLEPLTRRSLGKYVLAESPNDEALAAMGLTEEIEEIKKYVKAGGTSVNRVGVIYDAVMALFKAPDEPKYPGKRPFFIQSGDIQADSEGFQVGPGEWGLGYKDLLICTANDRTSALAALEAVAEQGEGEKVEDFASSHFGRFLTIYRAFPRDGEWTPARNVACNPTLDRDAPPERQITHPTARLWAGLLNVRYRMLLAYLAHSFQVEEPVKQWTRTSRGLLVSWAFGEMYNVRSISEILMRLPMHPGGDVYAGPPFEMPYTLALPTRDADRWRTHRDLFLMSRNYINLLLEDPEAQPYRAYLEGLRTAGEAGVEQAITLIGG